MTLTCSAATGHRLRKFGVAGPAADGLVSGAISNCSPDPGRESISVAASVRLPACMRAARG